MLLFSANCEFALFINCAAQFVNSQFAQQFINCCANSQGRRNPKKKSGPAIGRGGVRGGAPAFIFASFCMIHINMHVYAIYWGLMKTDHARAMLIDWLHIYTYASVHTVYNKGNVISKLAKNV